MKTKTTPVRVRFAPLCLSEEALLNGSERPVMMSSKPLELRFIVFEI